MTGGTVVVLGPTGRNFAAGMSGGRAFVLAARPRAGQPRAGRPRRARRVRREDAARRWSRRTSTRPVRRSPSGCWPTGTTAVGEFTAVVPRDYKRHAAGHDGRAAEPNAEQRDWRWPMPDPTGFLATERQLPARRPVPVRIRTGARSTRRQRRADHARRPPAAWTAASRSATTAARWATGSRTGTTWSAPGTGRARWRRCTPPTTSRSSPAGSARRRARRPACWASPRRPGRPGHHQAGRGRDHQPGVRAGPGRAAAGADRLRATVAVVGSGPAGLAAAQQLARAGHAVTVFERDDARRRPAALRHPRLQAGEAPHRPAAGAAGGRGRRVPDRRRRRRRHHRGAAARATTTRCCWPAARWPAGTCRRRPGATLPACTWRWSTWSRPTARCPASGATGAEPDRRRRQARGHHRRRRHRGRLPRRRPPPGRRQRHPARHVPAPPADRDAARDPWPTWPWILRNYPAHEEGGERVFAVAVTSSSGRRPGRSTGVKIAEVSVETGERATNCHAETGHRAGIARRPRPAGHRLHRNGRLGGDAQLGLPSTVTGGIDTNGGDHAGAAGVFFAGDMHRGASLVVSAIAEGRAAATAIHTYLERLA